MMIIENDGQGDELLAVFDSAGNRIGVKTRSEVHRSGDLHWVSFLLAARVDRTAGMRFLFQLRGRKSDPYRGQVDCLAGGHVAANETQREAIVRECREEAGVVLDPAALVYLGKRFLDNPTGVCRKAVDHFYLPGRPILIEELSFTDEAEGFVEVDLEEFARLVDRRQGHVEALGKTKEHGGEVRPMDITFDQLSAYAQPALENFRRSALAVRTYLETGTVDEGVWE